MFGISSATRQPAAATAGAGTEGAPHWISTWRPAGSRIRDPRTTRIVMFATAIALGLLLTFVGAVLIRSATPLHSATAPGGAEACKTEMCVMASAADSDQVAVTLPREWRGHRKPYTFDHMYRKQ